MSARETLPSQPSHSRGCSQLSLSRVHTLCSTFTRFPPIFRPTLSTQLSMAHYPHTSYSRPTRRRKATARIPPALDGIGEAFKSTNTVNAADTLLPVEAAPVQ